MEDYILETNNLTKKYNKFMAVENVNIHIKKGDIYGFIGKNGAGKSTCMKIFSGLIHHTSGTISLKGLKNNEIIKNNAFRYVGSLIESPGLYPSMSAYDNLKLLSYVSDGITDKRINEVLDIVGLENTPKKSKGFSLGMKQRLGIAIALLNNPELLILDEPINGLDPQGIVEIRNIIERLSHEKGMTIMISSHILDELEKVATTIGIIHKGKLLNEFDIAEFGNRNKPIIELVTPNMEAAISFISKDLKCNYILDENNMIIVKDYNIPFGDIINKLVKNKIYISNICEKRQTLEQYYLSMTSD